MVKLLVGAPALTAANEFNNLGNMYIYKDKGGEGVAY
jgi:hypothetical protein